MAPAIDGGVMAAEMQAPHNEVVISRERPRVGGELERSTFFRCPYTIPAGNIYRAAPAATFHPNGTDTEVKAYRSQVLRRDGHQQRNSRSRCD